MNLHICKDSNELSIQAAEWITGYIRNVLAIRDRFTIALSGGSTPQQLHLKLAASPYKESIDWSRIHFFWGDERAIAFTDDRNNAKMAFDTLLNHVPIRSEQVHTMRTDMEPEASAQVYDALLHQYFDGKENSFDLVLLGMGDDGHTLSLFPGTAIINEQTSWAKAFYLAAQSMYRISLTAPIVNRAAAILFLATGKKKAATLKQVLHGPSQPELYPSQLIKPLNGELHWFIDQDASAELDQ